MIATMTRPSHRVVCLFALALATTTATVATAAAGQSAPATYPPWRSAQPADGSATETVHGTSLGPQMFQSIVARASCGAQVVADSLDVVLAPPNPTHFDDVSLNFVFVNRRGRPLIYWVH